MASSTLVKCTSMTISIVMLSYPNVTLFLCYISEHWTTACTLDMTINHKFPKPDNIKHNPKNHVSIHEFAHRALWLTLKFKRLSFVTLEKCWIVVPLGRLTIEEVFSKILVTYLREKYLRETDLHWKLHLILATMTYIAIFSASQGWKVDISQYFFSYLWKRTEWWFTRLRLL